LNIFILDNDPYVCAEYMFDKHISKMLVEQIQILSTNLRLKGCDDPRLYKITHQNHPCCKWARESSDNFDWVIQHSWGLYDEYRLRYGDKLHKSGELIKIIENYGFHFINKGLTPFALAMPDEYKTNDPVQSYRQYYQSKSSIAKWEKGREKPEWYKL
jgi:hypothetical protein